MYKKMTEKFQCPGCVCGSNTNCGSYEQDEIKKSCKKHVIGTSIGLNNKFALGLPKGFCKPGFSNDGDDYLCLNKMHIRFYEEMKTPIWNNLNVPVWALEQNGYLFVRTYCPRLNISFVDIVKNGTLKLVPNAINVAEFINDID